MEHKYFFVFGRVPELSVAELSRLVAGNWTYNTQAAFLDSPDRLDLKTLSKQLAGIVKLGEVIAEVPRNGLPKWLESYDWKQLTKRDEKFYFGLSDYTIESIKNLKALGLGVKRQLKKSETASRYVTSKERQLSSVIVAKNKLLTDGVELCFFSLGDKTVIGQTRAVQDFEYFGKKDYGRPANQAQSGMLPPKVARMMIHIAKVRQTDSLLDPFCGAGTVLQEAADIGLTELVGADIEATAVEHAKKNLQWYKQELNPSLPLPNIIQSDVLHLSNKLLNRTFTRIVSEGYLGPPLSQRVTLSRREEIVTELEGFYRRALPALSPLLSPQGIMVLALPALRIDKEWHKLNISTALKEAGLSAQPILPEQWTIQFKHHGKSILYFRPQQQVAREIYFLVKQ